MGAWIETGYEGPLGESERVAPRVGAWIETDKLREERNRIQVAPRVGAWIETCFKGINRHCGPSRPAWARGLKPPVRLDRITGRASRPAWARGLKLCTTQGND